MNVIFAGINCTRAKIGVIAIPQNKVTRMRPKTYLLAKAIQERKDVLFGSVDAMFKPQNQKDKEEAWEAVRSEMIENGFTNFEKKGWKDVRNHDWQYLRRSAIAKLEHNQKAGAEPIQYSEIDKIVFDIMGNETEASFNDAVNDMDGKSECIGDGMGALLENGGNVFESLFGVKPSTSSLSLPAYNISDDNNNGNNFSSGTDTSLSTGLKFQNRKMSSETTNSSKESNNDNSHGHPNNNTGNKANHDIPLGINVNHGAVDEQILSQLNFLNNIKILGNSAFSQPNETAIPRKRAHHETESVNAPSSAKIKSIEDDMQGVKLKILQIQARREEALLQQERARALQEEAKLRQEEAKVKQEEAKLRQEEAKARLAEIELEKWNSHTAPA